jgi:RNA polymerase sigma-70 factor, ECF subfamily
MRAPRRFSPATPEQALLEQAPRVYSLAFRLLGSGPDADSVTHDVLLRLLPRLGSFRGEGELTTWLLRATVAAVLDRRRDATGRSQRPAGGLAKQLPGGGDINRPAQLAMERAIAGLPPVYRDVYVLADVEGLAGADVGAVLGLRLGAVKSRLHRARLLLRAALASHFEETDVP